MTAAKHTICLIEDDEIMGEALSDRFALEGFKCDWLKDGRSAAKALRHKRYDLVVCDIQLPDTNGETLFADLQADQTQLPPFIFITGFGAIDRAVRLLKLGAHDNLTKPLDIHALLSQIRTICAESPQVEDEALLGISHQMRWIAELMPRLSGRQSSILITGESGVGKEQVARAIHRSSDPSGERPFVAVNCGALTESLVESELFGHVKGSFTGAVREKKGCFELADGGTLFLDEIGEMPLNVQTKLLRALQERQILRVGGEVPIPVDIRLICATNQDLLQMVGEGKFREDLYYRIHVVHLNIPPLRERKDDILWLAERFLGDWAQSYGDRRSLSRSAERALLDYPWPGNIRELKHCLERATILYRDRQLSAEHIFGEEGVARNNGVLTEASLSDYLRTCERQYISDVLLANNESITETANALGISRKNLWEKMKKLGLSTSRQI